MKPVNKPFAFEDYVIKKRKPLTFRQKKWLIGIGLFLIITAFTFIALSLPIVKNRSALSLFAEKYSNIKEYSSSDIWNLALKIITWLALVWGITIKIQQTILLKRAKLNYMINNKNPKTYENKIMSQKEAFKKLDKHEKYVEELMTNLYKLAQNLNFPLTGTLPFEVREVISEYNLTSKEKFSKIEQLLLNHNVDVENKEVRQFLKRI